MKVGHRQVVNMIRQGGNRLLIKVVTVSRNLDPEDTARKKGTAAGGRSTSEEVTDGDVYSRITHGLEDKSHAEVRQVWTQL